MSEENQTLRRQLLQKRATEIASLQMGEEWNDSMQSKEQVEAKLLSKYEATMRRETAMVYSFSHQQPWKKSAGTTNLLFMDPTNPQWGWSWLERYMAARPWEAQGEILETIMHLLRVVSALLGTKLQRCTTPSTPRSNAGVHVASWKSKPGPRPRAFGSGFGASPVHDSKSIVSVQFERNRRHSIAGLMVRDDESLASSPVPKYMEPTKSAKAKSRGQRLLGVAENGGGSTTEKGVGLCWECEETAFFSGFSSQAAVAFGPTEG